MSSLGKNSARLLGLSEQTDHFSFFEKFRVFFFLDFFDKFLAVCLNNLSAPPLSQPLEKIKINVDGKNINRNSQIHIVFYMYIANITSDIRNTRMQFSFLSYTGKITLKSFNFGGKKRAFFLSRSESHLTYATS